jgi:hypothetical protein
VAFPQKLPTKHKVAQITAPLILESAQTVPAVITFAPLIWLEEHIAPATERAHPGEDVNTPTLLPVTTKVFAPNVPMTTLSSEDTSRIGRPDMSLTDTRTPVRQSVTENSCPWEPCISNTVEPEEIKVVLLPETIKQEENVLTPATVWLPHIIT